METDEQLYSQEFFTKVASVLNGEPIEVEPIEQSLIYSTVNMHNAFLLLKEQQMPEIGAQAFIGGVADETD